MTPSERTEKLKKAIPLLIIGLGFFARLWRFGTVPVGLQQDEAFAAYEAWSLLTTGADATGYPFPIYLSTWGSGMNALETYLMIPFLALFGLKVWVARLPQLILGLLSLIVMLPTAKRLLGERAGLLASFLFAICPWHVMLSRWGLESNMAPEFLLFGLYFFLRGLENSRWLLLSALMTGLSLYAYATIWPFVPLILLLELLYAFFCGKLRFDRYLLLSGLLLGAMALPLLLFLAVNYGLIGEIVTPYFSVPKLLSMRNGEISFQNIPHNLKQVAKLLLYQQDGYTWNSPGNYGYIYQISMPFAVLGGVLALRRVWKAGRRFCPEALVLIHLLAACLLATLISVNVNRVNIIFIPLVLLTGIGLEWSCRRLGKVFLPAAVAVYLLFFAAFFNYYLTDHQLQCYGDFFVGMDKALAAVEDQEGPIHLDKGIYHADVLFYTQLPAEVFRDTVEYWYYPADYLEAKSFGRYYFDYEGGPPVDGSYIVADWNEIDTEAFEAAGYRMDHVGVFTVAVKP